MLSNCNKQHIYNYLEIISISEEVVVSSSSPDVCPLVWSDSTFTISERLVTNRGEDTLFQIIKQQIWCDFDCALSLICGNKMPARCNRGFYRRSYCLLNIFRAPLCPSSGAQEYYTVVAACGISCCGFQVAGLVWSWGLCVRFHTRPATWKPQHEMPQAATTV